jgi:hypothetical protein
MTATASIRQVQVERLSLNTELLHVMRLGMTIVLGVWLYLASSLGGDTGARRGVLPYQDLIQNRPPVDQRMFRELQEGLLEAEGVRSRGGAWPATETLAAEGIPPFALDPTRAGRYNWRMQREGSYVNYVGVPEQGGTSWLLVVQEPEPGVPPDQAFEDEEHHRLPDGTMLHVSAWSHAGRFGAGTRVVRVPQIEGWTQLYAVGPGAAAGGPAPVSQSSSTP